MLAVAALMEEWKWIVRKSRDSDWFSELSDDAGDHGGMAYVISKFKEGGNEWARANGLRRDFLRHALTTMNKLSQVSQTGSTWDDGRHIYDLGDLLALAGCRNLAIFGGTRRDKSYQTLDGVLARLSRDTGLVLYFRKPTSQSMGRRKYSPDMSPTISNYSLQKISNIPLQML